MKSSTLEKLKPEKTVRWFYLLFGLIPLLYLPGFGIWYREPKFIGLWIGAAIAAWQFSFSVDTVVAKVRRASYATWLCVFAPIVFFCLSGLSTLSAQNFGLALERTANIGASIILAYYAARRRISVRSLAHAAIVPLAVTILLNLLRAYANFGVMPLGGGLGGLIGERNPCAIFLAAAFPLVIALFLEYLKPVTWRTLLVGILTQGIAVAIVIARCRNAWLMSVIYLAALLFLSMRGEKRKERLLAVDTLLICGAIAIAVIALIPHSLHWRSQSPYYDSLSTIVSPEHSNGRIDLWRVGIALFRAHIGWGVGAGNAIIHLRDGVRYSGADPWVFGFLRNDLPLFNDYLQAFVENGIFGGVLFFGITVIAPAWLLFHYRHSSFYHIAGCLALLGISFSCIFDYTLVRAEGLMLFAPLYGALAGEATMGAVIEGDALRGSYCWPARLMSLFFICFSLIYGISFALRGYAPDNANLMRVAWHLWPYDNIWNENMVRLWIADSEQAEVSSFVAHRLRNWPFDPRSHLAAALAAEASGDIEKAALALRTGLHEVPGGRCNWFVWREADRFWKRNDGQKIWADAVRQDLFSCSRKNARAGNSDREQT